MDPAQLTKFIRGAMKAGKYSIGAQESISGMKGAKAVLCTRSIPAPLAARLKEEAEKHNVAIVELNVSSAELARMVGKPFRVSVLALRSVAEADLKALLR
jgi:ribosomal protein L30E